VLVLFKQRSGDGAGEAQIVQARAWVRGRTFAMFALSDIHGLYVRVLYAWPGGSEPSSGWAESFDAVPPDNP